MLVVMACKPIGCSPAHGSKVIWVRVQHECYAELMPCHCMDSCVHCIATTSSVAHCVVPLCLRLTQVTALMVTHSVEYSGQGDWTDKMLLDSIAPNYQDEKHQAESPKLG